MASSQASRQSSAAPSAPPKRFGYEQPRIFTPPLRELTPETSLGFDVIAFASLICGIELFPWQKWLLIHALELLPDGSFRFRTVVVLVARQSGKSTLSQILALWFMYRLGSDLVLGTAQDLDTAEEVWQGAVDLVNDVPELRELRSKVVLNNGKKMLELKSGSRYKVKAANRRAGRGLSGDLILLDELREHQSWDSWSAVTHTTMARPDAQVWALSNAGDASSIVLRYLRMMAHSSLGDPDGINAAADPLAALLTDDVDPDDVMIDDGDTLAIFEWSAPPGCDIQDRDGWAQANPSLSYSVTERTIASAAKLDPHWVFRTEVLCQWSDGSLEGPFPVDSWEAGIVRSAEGASIVGNVVACVDVSFDRGMAYVAFAGINQAGRQQVEIVAKRHGMDWVLPWLLDPKRVDLIDNVTGQGRGAPVSGLLTELRAGGVPVVDWSGSDLSAGSGAFYDAVRNNTFDHFPQPALDVAAATAVTKPSGDGWLWDRRRSTTDIAPLIAATGALWLLNRPDETPAPSIYENRGLVTL